VGRERNDPRADEGMPGTEYTSRQGQFLAFIYYYTILMGRPPAEADMERFFGTSPSAVHQMVLALERRRFIERTPGQSRSIQLLLGREGLPDLNPDARGSQCGAGT